MVWRGNDGMHGEMRRTTGLNPPAAKGLGMICARIMCVLDDRRAHALLTLAGVRAPGSAYTVPPSPSPLPAQARL